MSAQNPYVAGNSVGRRASFVGREDVLRWVERMVRQEAQSAILLFGQRRIGKTSVLERLAELLPSRIRCRTVYFDLQDRASDPLDEVVAALAQRVYAALGRGAPPLRTTAGYARTFQERGLPELLGGLKADETLVLLLDEFDVLADPKGAQASKAFFPYLRGLMEVDPRRLCFVFAIGRDVGDLTIDARTLFRKAEQRRISLLDPEATRRLCRLSEDNGTLRWSEAALTQVYALTNGHPYLTQELCSQIWERAHDLPTPPTEVRLSEVEEALDDTLDAATPKLSHLWDGLPPAARVVAAALAAQEARTQSEAALEAALMSSGVGVRVVDRELRAAPKLLEQWDLLEPEGGGYRFRVELLRRWVRARKPLRRVHEEVEQIDPEADAFYKVAMGRFRRGSAQPDLEEALRLAREALRLNENHASAAELEAEVLYRLERREEAVTALRKLATWNLGAARPQLVRALLEQAKALGDTAEAVEVCKEVLTLIPEHPEAWARVAAWEEGLGDRAFAAEDFELATRHYEAARAGTKLKQVRMMQRVALRERCSQDLARALVEERLEDADRLLEEYRALRPSFHTRPNPLTLAEEEVERLRTWLQAKHAIAGKKPAEALRLLAPLAAHYPPYRDAPRLIYLVATGREPDVAPPKPPPDPSLVLPPQPPPPQPDRSARTPPPASDPGEDRDVARTVPEAWDRAFFDVGRQERLRQDANGRRIERWMSMTLLGLLTPMLIGLWTPLVNLSSFGWAELGLATFGLGLMVLLAFLASEPWYGHLWRTPAVFLTAFCGFALSKATADPGALPVVFSLAVYLGGASKIADSLPVMVEKDNSSGKHRRQFSHWANVVEVGYSGILGLLLGTLANVDWAGGALLGAGVGLVFWFIILFAILESTKDLLRLESTSDRYFYVWFATFGLTVLLVLNGAAWAFDAPSPLSWTLVATALAPLTAYTAARHRWLIFPSGLALIGLAAWRFITWLG